MEVSFHVDDASEMERVTQLTQKTNQFNLCTNRYTDAQIEAVRASDTRAFISLSVKDKFGDSGLTGVAIVSFADGKGEINDFLMSCRVMGKNVEYVFMDYVMEFLKDMGCDIIYAYYTPTIKNKPVLDFYDKVGFSKVEESDGIKKCIISISDYKSKNIDYIKVNK